MQQGWLICPGAVADWGEIWHSFWIGKTNKRWQMYCEKIFCTATIQLSHEDRHTHIHTDPLTDRLTDQQTDRQTDWLTDKQIDRPTD